MSVLGWSGGTVVSALAIEVGSISSHDKHQWRALSRYLNWSRAPFKAHQPEMVKYGPPNLTTDTVYRDSLTAAV